MSPVREIYLDNSATTPILPEVLAAMTEVLQNHYGNPSSLHHKGVEAEAHLKEARRILAAALGAEPEEIIFTSGGTEANNLALVGGARALRRQGQHLITTRLEHPSVLETCAYLEKEGFAVTYLPCDAEGVVHPEELAAALQPETILVSTMQVNNELGSIQPLEAYAQVLAAHRRRHPRLLWHVDAVQSFARLPLQPAALGIDLVSMSAHKLHGPKGSGALYVKKGTHLLPLLHGGGQERNLRPGTENLPGIVGFARAVSLWLAAQEEAIPRLAALKAELVARLQEVFPDLLLNGPRPESPASAPHILNLSFPGLRGEVIVHALEEKGIYVATGSACSSHSPGPSHVVRALGRSVREAEGAIRISLSRLTTREEILALCEALPAVIHRLKELYS